MTQILTCYFSRANTYNIIDKTNRASTDALTALVRWGSQLSMRKYKKLLDIDDYLKMELSFDDGDRLALQQLNNKCSEVDINVSINSGANVVTL